MPGNMNPRASTFGGFADSPPDLMPAGANCNTLASQDVRATTRVVDRPAAAEPNTYFDRLSGPVIVWDGAAYACLGPTAES